MKLKTWIGLFGAGLFAVPAVNADTFGSGANQFTMDFVDIGNAGNAADTTGSPNPAGSVGYNFRMGTYEVSRDMITKYNASNTLDPTNPQISLNDMSSYGGNGVDRPATGVSWNEAARFVNWLNTSTGHAAAYQFDTAGSNDNIALWEVGDAGYDASNPFRNSNAYYFLPSEDEWYKAAYYDPDANGGLGGYWDYATGSDTAPTAVASGTTSGTAVYIQSVATGPADIDNAGGLSPYGTMAQNGNVFEWGENGFTAPNESAGEVRVLRGGDWFNSSRYLSSSSSRLSISPSNESANFGFRVASVPEPSSLLLSALGLMAFVSRRRR